MFEYVQSRDAQKCVNEDLFDTAAHTQAINANVTEHVFAFPLKKVFISYMC